MDLRKLFVVAGASLFVSAGAMAQTAAGTPEQPEAAPGAPAKPSKKKKKSGTKKSSKKSRKKKSSTPATGQMPALEPQGAPDDGEPPQLTHQLVAAGIRGKPLTIAAHAIDANGVFGPILSVRKKGLGAGDYVPIKMVPSKIVPGLSGSGDMRSGARHGDQRVQLRLFAIARVGRLCVRRRIEVVLRQEREQVARVFEARLLVRRHEVRDT